MDPRAAAATPPTIPAREDGALADALAGLSGQGERFLEGEVLEVRPPGIEMRRAIQTSLGRPVILQRPVEGAPEPVIRSLRREARLLARLDHPNILPVHDVIDDVDGLVAVSPEVPGRPWSAWLGRPHVLRARFGEEDVLAWHVRVLLRVCAAVAHAHALGVIHRDLRPGCIWIGEEGQVYVAHWSLACRTGEATPLTDDEASRLGRAAHFAPEMVLRSAGRVGPRTDVYQLGGLLYEVLTGSPPHPGDDPDEAVRHVLFHDPQLPDDVPPSLARVCQRALSRNPAARHPDVEAFQADLEQALAQRAAWATAREADHHLERLRHLLRDPEADRVAIYRTWGAIRLGYLTAAEGAPDLAACRFRLGVAADTLVSWQLERGDEAGAQAVLDGLDDPPAAAVERLEAHRRGRGPVRAPGAAELDRQRSTWFAAVLSMVWVPLPLLALATPDGPWSAPGQIAGTLAMSVLAWAAGRWMGPGLPAEAPSSRLVAWMTWGPLALAALTAVGWAGGLPDDALRALASAGAVLVAGSAAVTSDLRLLPGALLYGLACVASLAWSVLWAPAMVVAGLGLAVGLLWPSALGGRDG